MKILYHHRTRAEDGQAVHIRALQRAFEQEGHEVHEVSLVPRQPSEDRTARPPRDGWGFVDRIPRFARELFEYGYSGVARGRILRAAAIFEPDFVYERYAFGNAAGVMAARRARLPIVLEVNSPMVLELSRTRGLAFPRLARRMESWIFGEATLVCAVTEVLAGIVTELGVDPARVLVTPNGVHLESYGQSDREAARAELGLELASGELVLGFVGYYRDWHRLDLVIDALAQPELRSARLCLVGEGPAHESLEQRARAAGVRERVHFAGPRRHDRIPALLSAFDVALVPAINPYASPLKLHEYMAAGLPAVAPDQPNLREVLEPGQNALLVPPGDGPALAAALARLCRDPKLRAELGRAARQTVVERDLTWRGNARRVVAAVEALS